MTTRTINDTGSLARQRELLKAMSVQAERYGELHQYHLRVGNLGAAGYYATAHRRCLRVAERTRTRLAAWATGTSETPGLADVLARLPDDKLAQVAPAHAAEQSGEWLPEATVAPPLEFQVYAVPQVRTVEQAATWLRYSHPDMWWLVPYATLRGIAEWLLRLRAACWSGRWRP